MTKPTKIFFHVGLGKTATTYLQYKVFPKLKNIYYIQRTRYKKSKQILAKKQYDSYLISREFDQQLEVETRWFAEDFTDVTPIIVLRKQGSWIASQYRRFVKNGFALSFEEFIDVKNDTGYFKKDDLDFYGKIKLLEETYEQKPIVLFYDDMRQDPLKYYQYWAQFLGAELDEKSVNLTPKHKSYKEQQLSAILSVSKHINLQKREYSSNIILQKICSFFVESLRYTILYTSPFLPASWFSKKYTLSKESLEEIENLYAENWQKCHEYAKESNPMFV